MEDKLRRTGVQRLRSATFLFSVVWQNGISYTALDSSAAAICFPACVSFSFYSPSPSTPELSHNRDARKSGSLILVAVSHVSLFGGRI